MVTALIFLVMLGLIPTSGHIHYRSEITDYFSPEDPRLQTFLEVKKEFSVDNRALVLIKIQHGSWLDRSRLEELNHWTNELGDLDGILDIDSILRTPISIKGVSSSETLPLNKVLLGKLLSNSEIENQLANYYWEGSVLINEDRSALLINFELSHDQKLQSSAYSRIKTSVLTLSDKEDLTAHLLGEREIKAELHRSLIHDALYLSPIVLLCGLAIMWLFHRSFFLIVAGTVPIIITLILSYEVTATSNLLINQTSALAFGVIFIIALADVIHLLSSYRIYTSQGKTKKNAMALSIQSNLSALATTTITTMVGFLSFNFSPSPTFATFGNISAMGIGIAFFVTLAMTPLLATHVPVHQAAPLDLYLQKLFNSIAKSDQSNNSPALLKGINITFYFLVALLIGAIPLNTFHNDPLDYFDENTPLISDYNTYSNSFGAQHTLSLIITSNSNPRQSEWIYNPEFVSEINLLVQWLDEHKYIATTHSFLNTLENSNRVLHDSHWKWQQVPGTEQSLADQFVSYELLNEKKDLITLGISKNRSKVIVSLNIVPLQSSEVLQLERDIENWAQNNLDKLSVQLTGSPMLFAAIGHELTQQMFWGALYSLIIITAIIAITFRNIRVAFLSLIPNLIPCAVLYGIWGLTVGTIDIAAAGSLSICLGIVVDDTIHIIKRYTKFRSQGYSPTDSLQQTYQQAGSALLLTTLVLSVGFIILTLSIFGPNATTSLIIASVVVLALVFDFTLLPQLLRFFDPYLKLEQVALQENQLVYIKDNLHKETPISDIE